MALLLKHIPTGDLYPFNALLEKRGDMIRVEPEDQGAEPVEETPKRRRATKLDALAADPVEAAE